MASNRNKWKSLLRVAVGTTAALTGSLVSVVTSGGLASAAATVPPWEPDPQAAAPYGNIVFYDANGNQITSGNNLSDPFAWAVATTPADSGSVKATLAFYKPVFASPPNPQVWPGVSEGGPTAFNPATPAGTPPSVAAFAPTYPVVKATPNISSFASAEGTDPTAGYTDMIEVRMQDTALFGSQTSYWDTDIAYNNTASAITVNGVTLQPGTWAQVYPAPTATSSGTSLQSSASGGNLNVGQPLTLTATTPSGVAGSVNFFDGATFLGNVVASGGSAVYPSSGQYIPGGGSHSYTATFVPGPPPGDEQNVNQSTASISDGSTSSPVVVDVTAPASSTVVTSSSATSVFGQTVTFTATVTSSSTPVATGGTVAFTEDGNPIAGCGALSTDANGQAACSGINPGSVGTHTIVAAYSPGTAPYQGSTSSNFTQTVAKADTTTNLQSSANPGGQNVPLTLTATVTPMAPGAGSPTGAVDFESNGTGITGCTAVTLTAGSATCNTSFSSGGTFPLTAVYTPDSGSSPDFNGSTSNQVSELIYPATTTALSSASSGTPPTSVFGQTVTFTATVTSSSGTVNGGTVDFTDSGNSIGCDSVAVTNGTAACNTSQLGVGSHTIGASYSPGSAQFGSSTATPITQQVDKAATSTTLASGTNPSVTGQQVTFTATVTITGSGVGTPTGTVTFNAGATTLCLNRNVSTVSGQQVATCTAPFNASGSPYAVTATYNGDNDFNASAPSNTVSQIVSAGATQNTVASSANPVLTGQQVTFTATVSPVGPSSGVPAGTVTFSDGGTAIANCTDQAMTGGKATCTVTYSSAGSHTITAAFTDTDSNYSDSDSTAHPLTQTVQAVIPPAAPTGVKATAADGQVTLTWAAVPTSEDGGSPVTGYNVYVSTAPGGEAPPPVNAASANNCTKPIPGTSYNATGLTDGTTYYFTVTACNVAGESVPSAEVSATPQHSGYFLVGNDGGVFTFGNATFRGSLGNVHLRAPIVGMAQTADKGGYWLVGADGGVFTFGDAPFLGSLGNVDLQAPIVSIAATSTGKGYWLVAADGGVFTFGDARFLGSLGSVDLNSPILGIAATHDNGGYLLVGADGGVFSFGDAPYLGSLGTLPLAAPIVGIAMTADQHGYWLVGLDGGVFTFGDAKFHGSLGGVHLAAPVVGIQPSFDGGGYLLFGADGGVFAFGDAPYHGSLPGEGVKVKDITGVA